MTYLFDDNVSLKGSKESSSFVGSFGELVVGEKYDEVSVQFQYPHLNTDYDINGSASTTTGDGSITVANSYVTASSVTSGTAFVQSKDSIRYRAGHTGFADFTASFSGSGIGYAGPTDHTDGFALRVENGVASFGYIKSGVEKGSSGISGFDTQGSWNGDIDPSLVDWTKKNIFRVIFGYLGIANPVLMIKLDKWYTLHCVRTEGRLLDTHVDTPVFPISIKAIDNMSVTSGSWNGGTLGQVTGVGTRTFSFPNTLPVNGTASELGEVTLSGTNVATLALFESKTTYKTKTNKVKSRLLSYEFHVDVPAGASIGTVMFQIVAVSTLSGTPTGWTDVDTDNSVFRFDSTSGTGASQNVTAGKPIITRYADYVGANKGGSGGGVIVDAERIGAVAYPGDMFAIIAKDTGGNNVTVRVDLTWEELFS